MNEFNFSTPISLKNIKITDDFWQSKMELIRKEVITYQWKALNDEIPGAAPSFCIRNFKLAAKLTKARKEKNYKEKIFPTDKLDFFPKDINNLEDRFYGFAFQDSDLSKWIETVSYSLIQHPDKNLESLADTAIDLIAAAAQENGYIDTFYIINDLSKVFTDLQDKHELYCFGHLTESAVAYYEATGKDKLLNIAKKFADYIDTRFGTNKNKLKGYPGHEIAEMALVRLYEITANDKYLKLSKYFIDERGRKPYYFDLENNNQTENIDNLKYEYKQAHIPVREQKEAVGHAVRAVYLYSGMADIARLTTDKTLYNACKKLWNNIVNKKMYITEGIGGTRVGEAFSLNYDLPNDTAYSETCAAIGLIFFCRRMLQIEANSKYADIMELALYNGVLSGISLDGKSFFYVNPLEVVPKNCYEDERKSHVKPQRQKWFNCACCPPNIARLISSIGSYAYTKSNSTFFIHLYVAGEIQFQVLNSNMKITINSNMPWNDESNITISTDKEVNYSIALRIPHWNEGYNLEGSTDINTEIKNGYIYITRKWHGSTKLHLKFNMKPKLIKANQNVREDADKVALMRGPLVYCIEEIDNGPNLHLIKLTSNLEFHEYTTKKLDKDSIIIETNALREKNRDEETLYSIYTKPKFEKIKLKWIPYYTWANRKEGEMSVWVHMNY